MRLTLATVFVFMLSNMPAPLYAWWERSLRFDAATTSTLFSAYQVGVLLGLLMLGRIVDRVGWRISLSTAALSISVSSVGFALAADPLALGIARLCSGVSIGIYLSCGAAAITASRAAMGKLDGPAITTLAVSSGLCLGPLSTGLLIGLANVDPLWLFIGQAALLLSAAVLAWLSIPGRSAQRGRALTAAVPRMSELPVGLGSAAGIAVMTVTGAVCSIYLGVGSSFIQTQLGSGTSLQAGLLIGLVFASAFAGQMLCRSQSVPATAFWSLGLGMGAATFLVAAVLLTNVAFVFASAVFAGASQGTGQFAGVSAIRDATSPSRWRHGFGRGQAWAYGLSGALVLAVGWMSRLLDLPRSLVVWAAVCWVGLAVVAVVVVVRTKATKRREAVLARRSVKHYAECVTGSRMNP
ncbi:MFS transporter [Paenarthrobacter sp. NPDC057981]|uniref:MFS transporter n=1 Tax=Paenarthrobacter sp. NPDC057981 TaxID=3346297 RepID=UPI0036DF2018